MKKTNRMHLRLSVVLCAVLIAVAALSMVGCASDNNPTATSSASTPAEVTQLGQGNVRFTFEVVGKDGAKSVFSVRTDESTVGAALLKENLISGEQSTYGLYVKTVNGITLDYNTDGMYWALNVNGEYSMNGVDSVTPVDGATYTFKAEK